MKVKGALTAFKTLVFLGFVLFESLFETLFSIEKGQLRKSTNFDLKPRSMPVAASDFLNFSVREHTARSIVSLRRLPPPKSPSNGGGLVLFMAVFDPSPLGSVENRI